MFNANSNKSNLNRVERQSWNMIARLLSSSLGYPIVSLNLCENNSLHNFSRYANVRFVYLSDLAVRNDISGASLRLNVWILMSILNCQKVWLIILISFSQFFLLECSFHTFNNQLMIYVIFFWSVESIMRVCADFRAHD